MKTRLQKILSGMGITSRRKAEELIEAGRVTVNGEAAVLGTKADPEEDSIKLDGKLLLPGALQKKLYFAFHKPKEVVSTLEDPEGRAAVGDFLKAVKERVYPVGRLDYHSEGLLLVTNDGEFANSVLHPSKKIPKTYEVKVKGELEEKDLEKLRTGMRLEGAVTAPAKVRPLKKTENNSWVEMVIYEGRKRQIRKMMDRLGHPVLKLKRVAIAGIKLGYLKPGELRHLRPEEVNAIRRQAGGPASKKQKPRTQKVEARG